VARARKALEQLKSCSICPRACAANRLAGETGTCRVGRFAQVSSYFPHQGEEDCLRGWGGSGTIFMTSCNLRCVFCQNFDISHSERGQEVSPVRLAEMMLELQAAGCHNINWVTPSHSVPQLLEALALAAEAGLRLPVVYNTSAYDSLATLELLDGVVDIYMPDFKFWGRSHARRYMSAPDYPEVARAALKEMHRQVGDLQMDADGLATRGVLVRHLVMPGDVAGTKEILTFLAEQLSPDTYVNVMAQYHPAGKVSPEKYSEINRRATTHEYARAVQTAQDLGLRLDERRPIWRLR
jgi:putative pyruvate formate lyase activating enzyme